MDWPLACLLMTVVVCAMLTYLGRHSQLRRSDDNSALWVRVGRLEREVLPPMPRSEDT